MARSLPILDDARDPVRPKTRGDCAGGVRPCPWASCEFSLLVDVSRKTGRLSHVHVLADHETDAPRETCVLDLAHRDDVRQREVGAIYGLSRERARQIEETALETLNQRLEPIREALLDSMQNTSAAVIPDAEWWDVVDPEFKAQIEKAYLRIVPAKDRRRGAAFRGGRP